jgi:hypothetical protein
MANPALPPPPIYRRIFHVPKGGGKSGFYCSIFKNLLHNFPCLNDKDSSTIFCTSAVILLYYITSAPKTTKVFLPCLHKIAFPAAVYSLTLFGSLLFKATLRLKNYAHDDVLLFDCILIDFWYILLMQSLIGIFIDWFLVYYSVLFFAYQFVTD